MKAAYVTEKDHIEFREDPLPELSADEALVRIAYTGICGSDVHLYQGAMHSSFFPVIPGHEFSGVIEKIRDGGKNPNNLKPGDKVAGWIVLPCGMCDACIDGYPNLCRNIKVYGSQTHGTFREYISAPLKTLYKLPGDADLRFYALVEPMAVAAYAVRETPVLVCDSVLVIGGGPIGLCTALVARKAGASQVVVSEIADEKIERIKSLGFTVINPLKTDALAEVKKLTDGHGFNCVLEASATAAGYELMVKAGSFRAKGMNIGQTLKPMPLVPREIMITEMYIKAIRIHQPYVFGKTVEMFKNADERLRRDLYRLISHDFDFPDLKDAFDFCVRDTAHCKVMVKVT
jgi:threonine dehydrogenase-like Zn-dependent dehydrogenase